MKIDALHALLATSRATLADALTNSDVVTCSAEIMAGGYQFFTAGIAGFAMGIVGYALSQAASSWLSGIARNPEASSKMQVPGFVALSMIEALGLFCLIIAILAINS